MSDRIILGLRKLSVFLKKIPGMVLLLEPFRKMFASRGRVVQVSDFDGLMNMRLRLDEHMQSQIFWYGYYSRDIILLMNRLLKPGDVVADVGANIGEISLAAAKRVGGAGKVYSFEPMTTLFERLVQHIEMNNATQITPVRQGLADGQRTAVIYAQAEQFNDGTSHTGLGTIYPFGDRSQPVEEIQLNTLDNYCEQHAIERLDLIKIDVEGAELDVLRGAQSTLQKYKPFVILELQSETAQSAGNSAEEIISLVESNDYEIYVIGRKTKLSRLDQEALSRFQNVLCVPRGKAVP